VCDAMAGRVVAAPLRDGDGSNAALEGVGERADQGVREVLFRASGSAQEAASDEEGKVG